VSLIRTLARNLASMSVMRLGSALLSFALFWFLARSGDAAFLGTYAFLLGVFAFLQQLPLLGLQLAAIRDVSADAQSAPEVVANLGGLGVATALLLGTGCALAGVAFYPADMRWGFVLIGCSMLPTAWTNLSEAILVGHQRMGFVAGINLGEATARAAGSALAVAIGGGLDALFAVFLLARIGAAACYWFLPQVPRWEVRLFDWRRLRGQMAEAPAFLGIMIFSAAISRFDLIFLSLLGSFSDVGVYAVAAKVYEAALMAPAVITSVLYPAYSRAAEQDRTAVHAMLKTTVFWVFLLALPCAIGVALLAQSLVGSVFGDAFAAAAPALQILMAALVLLTLNQALTLALLACHEQRSDLNSLLVSSACIVFLLPLLIPAVGMVGAAWAVFGAQLAQLGMRTLYVLRRLGMAPGFGALWRPGLAGLAMVATAQLLEDRAIVIRIAGAFLAYGLALYLSGGLRGEMRRAVTGLLRAR